MRKAPKRECNPAYLLVAVGLIVVLSGCSGEYPTYPITGTVRFPDGSPLTVGQIYFETRDERYGMGISAMASTSGTRGAPLQETMSFIFAVPSRGPLWRIAPSSGRAVIGLSTRNTAAARRPIFELM